MTNKVSCALLSLSADFLSRRPSPANSKMATSPPRALEPPPRELIGVPNIIFLHPGYSDRNCLLRLPRVDQNGSGVHYGTALVALQIIANNAFETGYLAEDENGQQPVDMPLDNVLTRDQYYFFVRNGPIKYPVVPSFNDWEFPHGALPKAWRSILFTPPVLASQSKGNCCITGFTKPTEEAHLVPGKDQIWYMRNDMHRYGAGPFPNIDNEVNIAPIRRDLHYMFDDRMFAIVPRHSQLTTHLLLEEAADFWPTCHNILVQRLDPRCTLYIFARFAWTVLFQVKMFVCGGRSRWVVQVKVDPDNGSSYEAQEVDAGKLASTYGGGASRDATPVRKRGQTEVNNTQVAESESECYGSEDDWCNRGRRRQPNWCDETAVRTISEQIDINKAGPEIGMSLEQEEAGFA